jgi:hypothetical protein
VKSLALTSFHVALLALATGHARAEPAEADAHPADAVDERAVAAGPRVAFGERRELEARTTYPSDERPAVEARTRLAIEIGPHGRSFGATSAAILATDSFGGGRVTVGRGLTRTRVPYRDADVGVYASFHTAFADGQMFGVLATRISQHAFGAGVRLAAPVWWRLSLVGQAEVGVARTALDVSFGDMTPVDDHAWGPYGAAMLGGELALSQHPRFQLAIRLDTGYVVTAPVELRALPADRPDEQLSIPTTFASIGKLDTRGLMTAFALRGSF